MWKTEKLEIQKHGMDMRRESRSRGYRVGSKYMYRAMLEWTSHENVRII